MNIYIYMYICIANNKYSFSLRTNNTEFYIFFLILSSTKAHLSATKFFAYFCVCSILLKKLAIKTSQLFKHLFYFCEIRRKDSSSTFWTKVREKEASKIKIHFYTGKTLNNFLLQFRFRTVMEKS